MGDPGTTNASYQFLRLPEEYASYGHVVNFLCAIFCSVMLVLGTFGNVMTFRLMRFLSNSFDDPSICLYFLSLAAVDQMLQVVGAGRMIVTSVFHYDVRTLHVAVCKLHKFLVLTAGRMDTWILVALTFQRVRAVVNPLEHRQFNTRERAVRVIASIAVLASLTNADILVFFTLVVVDVHGNKACVAGSVRGDPTEGSFYWHWSQRLLHILAGFVVPSLFILVNNSILLRHLKHHAFGVSPAMEGQQQQAARVRQVHLLSRNLVLTSLVFIALTAPIPITTLLAFLSAATTSPRIRARLWVANAVLSFLWYLNSCLNFYLYLLLGPTFRAEVVYLMCGRYRRSSESAGLPNTRVVSTHSRASSRLSRGRAGSVVSPS